MTDNGTYFFFLERSNDTDTTSTLLGHSAPFQRKKKRGKQFIEKYSKASAAIILFFL